MRRCIALSALLLLVPAAGAQSDDTSWLTKPYHLQIAILAEPHPLLTPEYLGRLEREVRDTMQRDLGKAAVVEVQAESARDPKKLPPAMKEVAAQGWDALDKPTQPITGKKLHLVRLRYEDGEYALESRQIDGDTGLVSPLRKTRTGDRQWVARAAALMLGQDFGLTANIQEITEQTITFQLRAANLGQAESIQVRVGEVFAISRIFRGQGGLVGRREEHALLFVTGLNANTGKGTGRLYARYQNSVRKDARDRSTLGFRAIKLGTLRTPLQVKVVEAKSGEPVAGCEVLLYPGGFPNRNEVTRPPERLGATDSAGLVSSANPIDHIGFARFQIGQVGVNVPIALFDGEPVIVRLTQVKEAEELADFNHELRQWERPLIETRNHFQNEYEEIATLRREKKDAEMLARMDKLAAKLKEDLADLKERFGKVREKAAPAGNLAKEPLRQAEEALKNLEQVAQQLEKMVADERNPSAGRKKYNEGQLAYENLKFDEALRAFEEAAKLEPQNQDFARRVDRLRKAWIIRNNPPHRAAREFIQKAWPQLGWRDLNDKFEEVDKQIEVLRTANDFLTMQLLVRANLDHIQKVQGILSQAQQSSNADEQQKATDLEDVLQKLRDLNRDLVAFIEAASSK